MSKKFKFTTSQGVKVSGEIDLGSHFTPIPGKVTAEEKENLSKAEIVALEDRRGERKATPNRTFARRTAEEAGGLLAAEIAHRIAPPQKPGPSVADMKAAKAKTAAKASKAADEKKLKDEKAAKARRAKERKEAKRLGYPSATG